MKRIIAALLAGLCLFALVGCSAGSKADSAAPKDYSQIIHDARTDEDNEYDMIFTKGKDGKFTAIDGYSAEYEADQLNDELKDIVFPLLGLEDGSYESFAASGFLHDGAQLCHSHREARRGQDRRCEGCTGSLCSERTAVHGALP